MLLIDWLDMTVPEWTSPRERDHVNATLAGLGARLFRFQHRGGWEVGTIQVSPHTVNFRFVSNNRWTTVKNYFEQQWNTDIMWEEDPLVYISTNRGSLYPGEMLTIERVHYYAE